MGYPTDVEIPGDAADTGYRMTNRYSGEYVVTDAVVNGLDMTSQYHSDLPTVDTSSHAATMLTYPDQYAAAAPMLTTVPYCAPLVADPYIVQHAGVSYPHQVCFILLLSLRRRRLYVFGSSVRAAVRASVIQAVVSCFRDISSIC